MPSNQPETPTTDALDAAVEKARVRVRDVVVAWWDSNRVPETRVAEAERALVAAVEARAVARAERVCVWSAITAHSIETWESGCGVVTHSTSKPAPRFCQHCGGRVRVDAP